jgi:hypothetical protein
VIAARYRYVGDTRLFASPFGIQVREAMQLRLALRNSLESRVNHLCRRNLARLDAGDNFRDRGKDGKAHNFAP